MLIQLFKQEFNLLAALIFLRDVQEPVFKGRKMVPLKHDCRSTVNDRCFFDVFAYHLPNSTREMSQLF